MDGIASEREVREWKQSVIEAHSRIVELEKQVIGLQKILGCAKLAMAHYDDFGIDWGIDEPMYFLDRAIKMYEKDERE